jgi:hypothetical protein
MLLHHLAAGTAIFTCRGDTEPLHLKDFRFQRRADSLTNSMPPLFFMALNGRPSLISSHTSSISCRETLGEQWFFIMYSSCGSARSGGGPPAGAYRQAIHIHPPVPSSVFSRMPVKGNSKPFHLPEQRALMDAEVPGRCKAVPLVSLQGLPDGLHLKHLPC